MTSTRLKLTISYAGTAYAGWQIQAASQAQSTVQKELETALSRIAGRAVRVHGAGRTDSGVHAEGQAAHADVPRRDGFDWQKALNATLPRDIRILNACIVPDAFHARYSATGKLYAYSLFIGMGNTPPRLAPFVWTTPPLDTAAMAEAAAILTGSHDFAAFQNTGTPVKDTVRNLWRIQCETGVSGPFRCPEDWPVMTWFFHGNGFLKQMVRNLMGLMVWVGLGKLGTADVAACLAGKDRTAVPSPTAPPEGLTLMRVEYAGEEVKE